MSRYQYRNFDNRQPETLHEAHIFLHNAMAHFRNLGSPKILVSPDAWSNWYDTLTILSEAATSVAIASAEVAA